MIFYHLLFSRSIDKLLMQIKDNWLVRELLHITLQREEFCKLRLHLQPRHQEKRDKGMEQEETFEMWVSSKDLGSQPPAQGWIAPGTEEWMGGARQGGVGWGGAGQGGAMAKICWARRGWHGEEQNRNSKFFSRLATKECLQMKII